MLFFAETVYNARVGSCSGFWLNLFFCWLNTPFRLISLTEHISRSLKWVGRAAGDILDFGIFFCRLRGIHLFSYIFRFSKYFVNQFVNF